ncbi:MAG: hypothetical protein FJ104_09760 [Deltaproteobacteria bacterium]|nr:hypothetical protein [Deltaproteobacteria bacterium]
MTTMIASPRPLLATLIAALTLLLAGPALAGGRVEWKSKTLKETESKSWTVEVSIFLNAPPDTAMIPVRFSFSPKVYYERTLMDGKEGPQLRKVPLENRQPLVESVDVGFLDPGTGQLQKRTRFSFRVTRGHGYEAGEYDVTIKDGRSDQTIGSTTRIVFDGENEVIDRRAITFSGEKKKPEKDESASKASDEPAPEQKKQLTEDDPAFWAGGPKSTEDQEQHSEVEPKRGGCQLGPSGASGGSALLLVAPAALALLATRRRARRAA